MSLTNKDNREAAKKAAKEAKEYKIQLKPSNANAAGGGGTDVSTKLKVEVNAVDTASATSSPTIRQIMASNNQLPKGTCTDYNGRKFIINTLQHLQVHFNNFDVNENSTLFLIGGVSNNSLAGSGMKLFSTPVTPEYFDVIGSSDGVKSGMSNLMLATYCAVVTSVQGGGVVLEHPPIASDM